MKTYTYAVDEAKLHLGGNFIEGDPATFSSKAWKYIIEKFAVKTVLDVGSGRGYAAKWFSETGLEVTAIDGLTDNVNNAIYPTIEIDLTVKPFIKEVDFVNCVEVVEHIEEKYISNLLDTLCSGKLILMTHAVPGQPGWHHVNCQESEYWIKHLESRNYKFLREESKIIQRLAKEDGAKHISRNGMIFKHE